MRLIHTTPQPKISQHCQKHPKTAATKQRANQQSVKSIMHPGCHSGVAGVGERIGRKWMNMENHCVDPALRQRRKYEESTSYQLEIGHLQSIFWPGLWAQGFEKAFWGQKLFKNTKYVYIFLSIWGNLGPSSFRSGLVFCTIMPVWPIA